MAELYISPTGLSNFFSCPAKYRFNQQWRPVETQTFFLDGTHAHELMTGEMPDSVSPQALRYYEDLLAMEKGADYIVLHRELRQKVHIREDVVLVRVIDAIVEHKRGYGLVDYKTANYPWFVISNGDAPASMGFQAVAYLMRPDVLPEGLDEWPDTILFHVASQKGLPVTYAFMADQYDVNNLMDAIDIVGEAQAAGRFPKNRGYGCKFCNFTDICFDLEGWQSKYEPKRSKK